MRALVAVIGFLCLLFCGCARLFEPTSAGIGLYYTPTEPDLEQTIALVEARNAGIERHPAWSASARQHLMITALDGIPESEHATYRRYLDGGVLYIIVHPAYHVFFHNDAFSDTTDAPLDSFLNEMPFSKEMVLLQEQERSLRDFLEITSTRKRLVLLVLPGDYRDYARYVYRDTADEFARYVNSVTNESPSVLYLYSEKATKGNLSKASQQRLSQFLQTVNPEAIVVGGGYLGRCIDDFYSDLIRSVDKEKVTIAGEISAISPDDLDDVEPSELLKDGRLDMPALRRFIAARYGTPRSWAGHPLNRQERPDARKRQG